MSIEKPVVRRSVLLARYYGDTGTPEETRISNEIISQKFTEEQLEEIYTNLLEGFKNFKYKDLYEGAAKKNIMARKAIEAYIGQCSYEINRYMRMSEADKSKFVLGNSLMMNYRAHVNHFLNEILQYYIKNILDDSYYRELLFSEDLNESYKLNMEMEMETKKLDRNNPEDADEIRKLEKEVYEYTIDRRMFAFKRRLENAYSDYMSGGIEFKFIRRKTDQEKIEMLINLLNETFKYERSILGEEECFALLTKGGESFYRGILDVNCYEYIKEIRESPIAKSFLSTTSDLYVALAHTTFTQIYIIPQEIRADASKKLLLEFVCDPGITIIDVDKCGCAPEGFEWQKEFIFPEGVIFDVIGECFEAEFTHDDRFYDSENGKIPKTQTIKCLKIRVSNGVALEDTSYAPDAAYSSSSTSSRKGGKKYKKSSTKKRRKHITKRKRSNKKNKSVRRKHY